VTVATTFRGKEVAESTLTFWTRPVSPAALAVRWGMEVDDGKSGRILYRADISWGNAGQPAPDARSFFVEVRTINLLFGLND
jgi:hypothetical protein